MHIVSLKYDIPTHVNTKQYLYTQYIYVNIHVAAGNIHDDTHYLFKFDFRIN